MSNNIKGILYRKAGTNDKWLYTEAEFDARLYIIRYNLPKELDANTTYEIRFIETDVKWDVIHDRSQVPHPTAHWQFFCD
jgi:hypothetical protein